MDTIISLFLVVAEKILHFFPQLVHLILRCSFEVLQWQNVLVINVFHVFQRDVCDFLQLVDVIPNPLEVVFGQPFEIVYLLHMPLAQALKLTKLQRDTL